MKSTQPDILSRTAELAYFNFLERQEKGLPGDERLDWEKAEADVRASFEKAGEDSASVSMIKGIGPKVTKDLTEAGVATVDDLAKLSIDEFARRFPRHLSRARSGQWLEQARSFSQSPN